MIKKEKEIKGWYKGYDMKWLRNEPQHPDFYLVEEYDKKYSNKKGGEIKYERT